MRVKLGIVGPLYLQVAILYLYSTIRYSTLDRSLFVLIVIFMFPTLILSVLAPFLISTFANLPKRIKDRLDHELDTLLISNSYKDYDESRTLLVPQPFLIDMNPKISDSIKEKLVPPLTQRAIAHYKDNFYSRNERINPVRSLEYFESLVLFSLISMILFTIDLIILLLMNLRDVPLYIIVLDKISDPEIILIFSIIGISAIVLSYSLFRYSRERMIYYLPYVVPILFNEPGDEQYFRRETIRSLMSYNLDNLIDRNDQKRYRGPLSHAIDELLVPLLRDEFLISARREFASKIAWRDYYRIINEEQREGTTDHGLTYLERLLMGQSVGKIKLNEKDLLGLHSDLGSIMDQVVIWGKLSSEKRIMLYFQLYRLIEYVLKDIVVCLNLALEEDDENNLYGALKTLYGIGYIDDNGKRALNDLRYRRNKLMHEPGITLDVSVQSITEILDIVNSLLEDLMNEDMDSDETPK